MPSLFYESAHPQWCDWRWQLAHAYTAETFRQAGLISDRERAAAERFPVLATPYYTALADLNAPGDPILRQILPDARELEAEPDTTPDPFAETAEASLAPGIKQRFPDRVLAMVQKHCAAYCRHCTRKHLLDSAQTADLQTLIAQLKVRPNVREVLLSGGDPLLLSDERILEWVEALAALPQLDAIRLCTRIPVVLPMRITEVLAKALGKTKRLWVNTQFNHPREITPESTEACARLVEAGIPVSNQSVLLKGINDEPEIMRRLCAGLERIRVRPYYIFVCDPIPGLAHFRIPRETARKLQETLWSQLGGLAVPRVVVDRPGAFWKENA